MKIFLCIEKVECLKIKNNSKYIESNFLENKTVLTSQDDRESSGSRHDRV